MSDVNTGMSFKYLIVDFFLLVASFFAVNYFKYETLAIRDPYLNLFIILLCLWLFISLLTKKFRLESFSGYLNYLFLLIRSAVYLLSGVALIVVLMGETGYSRFFVFGTCGLFVLLEAMVFTAGFIHAKGKNWGLPIVRPKDRNISMFLVIGDLLLFIFSFFLVNYFKRQTWALTQEYEIFFYIMLGLWVITAAFTEKFDKRHLQGFFFAVSPYLKSIIFMALIMATLVVGLEMLNYSRGQIFSFLLLFACLELVLLLVYYTNRKEIANDAESTREIRSIMRQTYLATSADNEEDRRSILFQPIDARMKDVYLQDRPQVYDFLNKAIDFSRITRVETMILDTPEMSNFTLVSLSHTRLMINLHRINDIRWINRYFLQAHAMLVDGGYLAGKAETIDVLMNRFGEKYPKYIREFFFFLHFIWARIFPKLNLTKKFYFGITRGKNRAISRTEILGRLSFCGFKIVDEAYIDNAFYFVAQKVKTPSGDESPSYGPFVRFERVGFQGNLIYTYKFRTMYPYSEYLQEYVHEKNQLQEGGKFKDDFRVTRYGKIMRKLWLDELPMLYNWLKGDLQLVGVRPISQHYLSLYTRDLQELRKKVKPGLIPPYYADMPKTLEDIMASEERYIKAYMQSPITTQLLYFFKAIWNIVVKKARSA